MLLVLIMLSAPMLSQAQVAASGTVAGKTVILKDRDLLQPVESILNSKVSGRGWDTRITQISLPQGIRLPAGVMDIEITPPPRWDGWGAATMTAMVRVNGRLEKNFSIRVTVDARADMVVAVRQIPSGSILTSSDLAVEKHDLATVNGKYVASIADVAGKKLRGTARQGYPLRSDQLEKVPVVKNGQMVTILAESSVLRISTTGRARGSGSVGDIVMVQNSGSLREIPATVLDGSTVSISF